VFRHAKSVLAKGKLGGIPSQTIVTHPTHIPVISCSSARHLLVIQSYLSCIIASTRPPRSGISIWNDVECLIKCGMVVVCSRRSADAPLLTIPRSENFVLTPSVPVQLGRKMTETLLQRVLDESK
jgi:hypothetical protein